MEATILARSDAAPQHLPEVTQKNTKTFNQVNRYVGHNGTRQRTIPKQTKVTASNKGFLIEIRKKKLSLAKIIQHR